MQSIKLIEKLFDVTITPIAHRRLSYTGEITHAKLAAVIAANPDVVEWQDPAEPCVQGVYYLALTESAEDERSCDSFTFDVDTGEFGIC